MLAGCASPPAAAPPAAPPPAAPEAPPDPWAAALAEFEARQRAAAEAAARSGSWSQALRAWDVLLALHPGDADLIRRRAQAQAAAQSAAADRLQRARQARQRGDQETASRLYLEALALAPGQAEAADALRAIERERVKRQFGAQLARNTPARRPAPAAGADASAAMEGERNEIEHASLLADQGELESAITLLKPIAASGRAEPAALALLAELYYRRAEALAASNPIGAIAALEQCLKTDPAHAKAAARLKQLRDAAKAPTTPAKPGRAPAP